MKDVVVIGYGAGNVASVVFALERLGARAVVTADPAEVAAAERVILPGVGAAGYAMTRLGALNLVEPLRAFPRPLLGVCLGQQLLFETSAEGEGDLLGLIPGRVERMAAAAGRCSREQRSSRAPADAHTSISASRARQDVPTGHRERVVTGRFKVNVNRPASSAAPPDWITITPSASRAGVAASLMAASEA